MGGSNFSHSIDYDWNHTKLKMTKGRLHQPHLNRHLANGHLTLSSH